MTVEQSVLVVVPRTIAVGDLVRDIVSAAERAEKADPGDRSDVVRYEALCVRLEAMAEEAIVGGAEFIVLSSVLPSGPGYCFEDDSLGLDAARLSERLAGDVAQKVRGWAGGATVVELRRGLELGATALWSGGVPAPEPSAVWHVDGDVSGSRAVEQRFRAQLGAIVGASAEALRTRGDSIDPSGVNNRIITQILREFVEGGPPHRIDAPVTYRDGSQATNAFPLRCLALADDLPAAPHDLELHLALLSIRHTEMDPVVDGAWLRNAEVSRPRPAALTDDFVYDTSRTQLRCLTENGRRRVLLHMYQTGLDTAVVGFYRAVVEHLLVHPFSLCVVPMFFASAQRTGGTTGEAPFRPGKPWTLGDEA